CLSILRKLSLAQIYSTEGLDKQVSIFFQQSAARTTLLRTLLIIAQRGSFAPVLLKQEKSLHCCSDLRFSKAQIVRTQLSLAHRLLVFTCLVNASHSIRKARLAKDLAQRLTHGSSGTKAHQTKPNWSGSSQAIKH